MKKYLSFTISLPDALGGFGRPVIKSSKFLLLLLLLSCAQRKQEEQAIVDFMKENAHDPGSYEPVSFEFAGEATYDNTGMIPGDTTRIGDLYRHTFRAKNGFGSLRLHTSVFCYRPRLQTASAIEDSVAESHALLP